MAAYLKEHAGIQALMDSTGKMGELTVWVNGRLVVRKGLLRFPEKQEFLQKVQAAL